MSVATTVSGAWSCSIRCSQYDLVTGVHHCRPTFPEDHKGAPKASRRCHASYTARQWGVIKLHNYTFFFFFTMYLNLFAVFGGEGGRGRSHLLHHHHHHHQRRVFVSSLKVQTIATFPVTLSSVSLSSHISQPLPSSLPPHPSHTSSPAHPYIQLGDSFNTSPQFIFAVSSPSMFLAPLREFTVHFF